MNKNYPLTGNVDVVFRAYSAYTLNGKSYEAGEPIAYIKNTQANIMYGGSPKTASAVKNLTSFTDTAPETISVEANVFKDAILKMFSELVEKEFVDIYRRDYKLADENGSLFLDSNLLNVFIYDADMNKQTGFTVDSESGLITGLSADTNYFIDYSVKKEDYQGFSLKTTSLPYITIELTGTFFSDKKSRNFLIRIPRAKLDVAPTFTFSSESFATTSIVFKIISSNDINGVDIYFY